MDFEIILILGLAAGYITKCLLLEEKDSHVGPFPLKSTFIEFPDSGHIQTAAFFDIIRNLFGVYVEVEPGNEHQTIWEVQPERSERFTCPFCLSFWVSILFTLGFMIHYDPNILFVIPLHFSLSTISTLTVGAINYGLQL